MRGRGYVLSTAIWRGYGGEPITCCGKSPPGIPHWNGMPTLHEWKSAKPAHQAWCPRHKRKGAAVCGRSVIMSCLWLAAGSCFLQFKVLGSSMIFSVRACPENGTATRPLVSERSDKARDEKAQRIVTQLTHPILISEAGIFNISV